MSHSYVDLALRDTEWTIYSYSGGNVYIVPQSLSSDHLQFLDVPRICSPLSLKHHPASSVE